MTGTIPSSLCSIYGITINIDCPNFSCTCCTNGTPYIVVVTAHELIDITYAPKTSKCVAVWYIVFFTWEKLVLSINTTFFGFLLVLNNQSVPCLYNATERHPNIHSCSYFSKYYVMSWTCWSLQIPTLTGIGCGNHLRKKRSL